MIKNEIAHIELQCFEKSAVDLSKCKKRLMKTSDRKLFRLSIGKLLLIGDAIDK